MLLHHRANPADHKQYACHDLSIRNKRQKSHLLSQNVFLQSIIYPSEKKIHWNKQHFGMSESRVLPTLSSSSRETAVKKIDCKTVHIFAYSSTREQSNKRSQTRLKTGDTNFTLQNQSAVKGQKESILLSRVEGRGKMDSVKSLGFVCSPSFFSLYAACRLFSRGVIFTRARVLLALLSLRKNGGLLVV